MRLPRRLTTIAAACCLALIATGCGDKPDPEPKLSTSPSTTKPAESNTAPAPSTSSGPREKASQSATPSADPNAKKPTRKDFPHIYENTERGAGAALEFFVESYRYSLISGDTSAMKEIGDPGCKSCNSLIAQAEGGELRFSKATWIVSAPRIKDRPGGRLDTAAHVDSDAFGATQGKRFRQSFVIGATMEWRQGRWIAVDAGIDMESK